MDFIAMKACAYSLVFVAILTLPAAAADYVIDTKGGHASINFRIPHLGYSWLVGRFDKFSGTFSYDDKDVSAAKIAVTIDAASINSNHGERDKHLRGADVLDTERFPNATFVSRSVTTKGVRKASIVGDLTLRGVTKSVIIDADYVGGGSDPWGGHRQGFMGRTTLVLADYGIVKNLGPAAKQVELELYIEGVRQ